MDRLLGVLLGLAACSSAAQAAPAPFRYQVTPVVAGNFAGVTADGINARGDVIGNVFLDDSGLRHYGFVNAGGVTTRLPTLGGLGSRANAINDAGVVVGSATLPDEREHAVSFRGGVATDLAPQFWKSSAATGINNAGTIVGVLPCDCDQPFHHAALFSNGDSFYVGAFHGYDSAATDINDAGQVIGAATPSPAITLPHAFIFQHNITTDLGTFGRAWAIPHAINELGLIAGTGEANAGNNYRAYLYANGLATNLGLVEGSVDSEAMALNNVGQVVGAGMLPPFDLIGFLWEDGHMVNLDDLVDPASGWSIDVARGINDRGQIAAEGCNRAQGVCGVLRLDPLPAVPEPSSCAMLAAGLGALGAAARRRRAAPGITPRPSAP